MTQREVALYLGISQSYISRLEKTKAMMQETDDDKAIMDMYRAYVNTPVGTIPKYRIDNICRLVKELV